MSSEQKRSKRKKARQKQAIKKKPQPVEEIEEATAEPVRVHEHKDAALEERYTGLDVLGGWRRALLYEYTFNLKGVPVTKLANNPDFGNIPLPTVQSWSKKDKWVERRRKFGEAVTDKVQEKMVSRVAKRKLDELKWLEDMYDKARNRVDEALANKPAKSFESALGALLKLEERITARRQELAAELFPVGMFDQTTEEEALDAEQQEQVPQQPSMRVQFTPHETQTAARSILRERCVNPEPKETLPQSDPLPSPAQAEGPKKERKKRPPASLSGGTREPKKS